MGCGASKCGDGDILNLCKSEGCLVSLCKERNDLIRAARECRNAVSASHVLYLQSLLDFGEALDVLLKKAIVDHHSSSSEVDSPLHSVEGTHLEVLSVVSGPVSSLTDEVHQGLKDGKTKLSSLDSRENENQILKSEIVSHFMKSSPQVITELHDAGQEFHASVSSEYMPNAPPMHYHPDQNNHLFPTYGIGAHPGCTMNTHYNKGYNFSNYVGGSFCTCPADSSAGRRLGEYGSERPMCYFRDMHQDYQPDALPKPNPVPSPPVANSTMDYFNVLSFTDNIYSSYYSRSNFVNGVGSGCPCLNNALEKEGIPPLEHTEKELPSKTFYISKGVKDTQHDANHGTSVAQPVESNEGHVKGGKSCYHNHHGEEIFSLNSSVGKDDNVGTTSLSSGEKKVGKTTTDDAKHSSKMKQAIVAKRPVIDIFETIHEISQAFLTAYNSGKEVADILETEKIPYLPIRSAPKGRVDVMGALFFLTENSY